VGEDIQEKYWDFERDLKNSQTCLSAKKSLLRFQKDEKGIARLYSGIGFYGDLDNYFTYIYYKIFIINPNTAY